MSNMSGWIWFGICCVLAVILPEATLGQPGCQIPGSSGSVTCATCDSTNTNCLSCFDTFQLDNSKSPVECVPCFEKCLQCTTTADACTICEPGYGPDPANVGTCGQCSTQNCEGICDKNGPGKCDICSDGYGVGTSKLCEPCPDHCKSCGSRSTSYCDICEDGYSAEDGVCVVSSGSTTLRTTPGGGSSTPTGGGASGPSTPGGGGGSSTQSGGGPGGSSTQGGGGPGGSSTQGGGGPGASTPGSGGPGASTPGSGGPGASTPGSGGPGASSTGSGEPGASTPSGNGGDSGLSDGAKAGIIIGIVCGVLALLFLCLLSWLLCRWRPAGYVEERPQQVYQQQPIQYYTSTQQPPTRPSYYPWNRHFSQDHNHGDATHAHRARHLEFS